LSYSRKQETQADEFGADILNCHYGHVAGVTDFFQKLLKENPGEKGFAGHYLSTHPETNRRIQHLEDYCRSRGFAQKDLQKLPDFQK
jgi:predicted Zn-dependent protease